MLDTLSKIFPFVFPPILGAVIGYVTNAIAIKMLFRPLTEKRFLGIRIPFTPGIIPKQREQLAEGIGNMVSRVLLTEEVLTQQLHSEAFEKKVEQSVRNFTDTFFNAPLETLVRSSQIHPARTVHGVIVFALRRIIRARGFEETIERLVASGVTILSDMRISDICTQRDIEKFVEEKLIPLLSSRKIRYLLQRELDGLIQSYLQNPIPIRELLPESFAAELLKATMVAYPKILDVCISWLKTPEMRNNLEVRGAALLKEILNKLNFFQKLLLSAGQYNKTLEKKMPEIVSDVVRSIERLGKDPRIQPQISLLIERELKVFGEKSCADALKSFGIGAGRIHTLAGSLLKNILHSLSDESVRSRIKTLVHDIASQPIGSFVFGLDSDKQHAIGWISQRILSLIKGEGVEKRLEAYLFRTVLGFLDKNRTASIQELIGIEGSAKRIIDSYLFDRILSLMKEKIPEIVSHFDIKKAVTDKVNSLDILDVEKLLLMVMAKQFKWINIFGGILGALIGGVQVILYALRG